MQRRCEVEVGEQGLIRWANQGGGGWANGLSRIQGGPFEECDMCE